MQLHFRNAEYQTRWAWTEGLKALGQREIAVTIPWPEHDQRDLLLQHLLEFLEDYLLSQPKRILPDQTFRYGWTLLRFVRDEHNHSGAGTDVLLLEENEHPFSHAAPSYVPGISRTVDLLQLQHDAIRRNAVGGEAIYPSSAQVAVICTRVNPQTIRHLRPLMAHRHGQPDGRDSGWFIGCCDQHHDHNNPDELEPVHLLHLVEQFPGLFPYLAMPVGTALLFEESRAVVFRPGEDEGQIDPGNLLTALP